MLHAARAMLLTVKIEPESHNAAITNFSLHFVKNNIIEKEFGKMFNETLDERMDADYGVSTEFTQEEAEARTIDAKKFVSRIKQYLQDKGFLT